MVPRLVPRLVPRRLAWIFVLVGSVPLNAFVPSNIKRSRPRRLYGVVPQQKQQSSAKSRLKRTSNLSEWAKENGVKIGGVQVQESELGGGGLGLMATRDLSSGSVLVAVPSSLALSVESPGRGPDDDAVVYEHFDKKVLQDTPWFVQFSAYLNVLNHAMSKKDDKVDMTPWLESLPQSFDTPIHWTQEQRDELQYPYLVDSVSRQETEWTQWYETIKSAANNNNNFVSFADFVWGAECARSRAFSGGYTGSAFDPLPFAFTLLLVTVYVGLHLGTLEQAANGAALVLCASILKDFVLPKLFQKKKKKYVICPFIDMANHKGLGATGEVSFEFFGDAYSLVAVSSDDKDNSVKSGSELYISYGPRSNDQLLQYYGFVEQDNPHDVYIMPPLREWDIEALEQATGRTFAPGRLEKLNRAGLLGRSASATATTNQENDDSGDDTVANRFGGVVVTRAGGVDPAVLQALRALVSTDEEWTNAGEAIGNFCEEGSGGPDNEQAARLAARTALEMELRSKPTTIQQDEEKLVLKKKQGAGTGVDALAIAFRLEKKKLLVETISTLP